MSAYIVKLDTLGRIAGFLYNRAAACRSAGAGDPILSPLVKVAADLGLASCREEPALRDACRELAQDMLDLNERAFHARYGDAPDGEQVGELELHSPTLIQFYASLSCWLYQCSEGDIPDDLLYRAILEVRNAVAHEIVRTSVEYADAEWR